MLVPVWMKLIPVVNVVRVRQKMKYFTLSNVIMENLDFRETADTFLTDYTWYCNVRHAMIKGISIQAL